MRDIDPYIEIRIITHPNTAIPASSPNLATIWLTWAGTWEFMIDGQRGERLSLAAALDWVSTWARNRIGKVYPEYV